MNAFYEHHKDSIRFGYRCFDRALPGAFAAGLVKVRNPPIADLRQRRQECRAIPRTSRRAAYAYGR